MKALLFLLIFFSHSLYGKESLSAPQSVTVNSPFTVTIPLENFPQKAKTAFASYLNMIQASRPLPEPYLLESYEVDDTTLKLKGRFLKEGPQELFLGTFVWSDFVFSFPHLRLQVQPVSLTNLSAENILLPFPQFSYTISPDNIAAQNRLFQDSIISAQNILSSQKKLYYFLLSFFLLSIILPCLHILIKKRLLHKNQAKQEISIPDELKKTTSWTALLILLRRISQEGSDITAYELAAHFSQKGENNLAHASLLIERYGYRNEQNQEQFSEAISSVTASISSD